MTEDAENPNAGGGLFGSVRRLIDNALGLAENRLELLSTDIHVERFNLVRMVLVGLAVLFCFQAGLFLAVLFVVLSAAEADRLLLIGVIALLLLAAALGGAIWLFVWLKTRPPFFAATVGELKKDRERLGKRKK
ncbi:MAG: phage holin family protein [Candidatus Eiseniibacteriota bacterium]